MPHNPSRLQVVIRADALVVRVHQLAERHRRRIGAVSPGLRSQLLRAATSISLNLGEACGYTSPDKSAALLDVAIGSCNEVERVLRLCRRLEVLDDSVDTLLDELREIRMMTYGFRKRLLSFPHSTQTSDF
ncbi:MAG: four helix bundle protein [Gemmatimonadetes bacterium]|nr:four helix bundle protein [Gemmatimonadota bacterium]